MSSKPLSAPAAWRIRAAAQVFLATACAALLALLSFNSNMERTCTVLDTPYLDLCPRTTSGSEEHVAALRARIASNPGDANAHVQLAVHDHSSARAELIRVASVLAPRDPKVLMMEAGAAFEMKDWAKAAKPLVELTEYRSDSQARLLLSQLIAFGHADVLAPYLAPGTRWFKQVLAQLGSGAQLSAAMPLVSKALRVGVIEPAAVSAYVRQLKTAGAWADAYSLWVALHQQRTPVLYNGSFDDRFEPDGFDWEVAAQDAKSRPGAIIDRPHVEKRGAVLEVRLTGRRMPVPLVRQYLFLGEGRYQIQGEYNATQLRLEQGMAWTVRCTASAVEAGRSAQLKDTGGLWQGFELDFVVPPNCGQVVSLQLETYAAFEAQVGGQGRFAFDALKLAKKAN